MDIGESKKTAEMECCTKLPDSCFYIERRFQKHFRFGCEAEDDLLAVVANDWNDLEPYFRGRKVIRCSDLDEDLTGTGNAALAILDTRGREDRDFSRLCEAFPERDVFWLEKCGRSSSFVVKRQKLGTLSEDDLVARPGRIKVVVGDPGSGKTALLKRLLDRFRSGLGIDLGTLEDKLEALRSKAAQNKSYNFGEAGSLDIGDVDVLFGLSGHCDHRQLFLDGFDDVCPDHQTTVVAALKLLRDADVRIWIVALPHSRPRLVEDLGVASYSFVALSSDEERMFLRRHWLSLVSIDAGNAAIDDFVEELLGIVSALRSDVAHRFVASPLLVELVVEVHIDDFGSSVVAKPHDVLELLDAYFRKQFEVALVERGHDFSDPERQTGVEDAFRTFQRRLTQLALCQLHLDHLELLVGDEVARATSPMDIGGEAKNTMNPLNASDVVVDAVKPFDDVDETKCATKLLNVGDELKSPTKAQKPSSKETKAKKPLQTYGGVKSAMKPLHVTDKDKKATKPSCTRIEVKSATKPLRANEKVKSETQPLHVGDKEKKATKPSCTRIEAKITKKSPNTSDEVKKATGLPKYDDKVKSATKPLRANVTVKAVTKPLYVGDRLKKATKPLNTSEKVQSVAKPQTTVSQKVKPLIPSDKVKKTMKPSNVVNKANSVAEPLKVADDVISATKPSDVVDEVRRLTKPSNVVDGVKSATKVSNVVDEASSVMAPSDAVDKERSMTALVDSERNIATKLLTDGRRFAHRTMAEYLVAKVLVAGLDEHSKSMRQRVVAFLQEHYFYGGLATMRVLLDRLLVQTSPVHEAALDDDLQKLVAILEGDVGAMVQGDALGRTALHLAASYCGASVHRKDAEEVIANCKSTLHLMCRSWQQIQIRDDLGFNAFSYAIGSLDSDIVAFQEITKMMKSSGEALNAIASNAMGMLKHVERHWAEPRFNFYGHEDLQDLLEGFFRSSEFSELLRSNTRHRSKMLAALHMASSKAIADAMALDSFGALKQILASGFFNEILADQKVSLVGLKDWQSEIVLLDDFRSWFRSAVSDCHLAALTAVLDFLDMETMRGLWEMPDVKYLPLFRRAVERMECRLLVHLITVFQKNFSELASGSSLVACLKKIFDDGRIAEFVDVFKMLPDNYKEKILEATNCIKAIEEAMASKDSTLLGQLSGLFYSDAKTVEMKAKVSKQNVLEFFGTCLQKRDFEMAMPLLRFICAEERQHVWNVLGHKSKFDNVDTNYVSFMSGLFKSRLKPTDLHLMIEFLHNFPINAPDLEWSVWEHIYCVIYNLEIRKPFPPNVQKCLGEDYAHRLLTNKQNFASVRHLFHLATDDQKRKICLQNDQEFFRFALTHFPQEIIDQRCGNGRYLKGIPDGAMDTDEYCSWFLDATNQCNYGDLLKLTTFSSIDSQLRLWRKVNYRLLFNKAFQDKQYDFVLNLLKVFKKSPDEDLLNITDLEEHLKNIPKESTDKLADILSYLSAERATKMLMGMAFVHQFQNAIIHKMPLALNRLFKTYKDHSMLVSAMKTSVEVDHYIKYFEHFLKTKDGDALWALLQYISADEKKVAKKVSKYSTSITNAVGLEMALYNVSEKYLQQMLDSLKKYSSAMAHRYDLSIWQHMLILLGCISYNGPGQFPNHIKQYFEF